MLIITRVGIFAFERFLPLCLYFYYVYLEDIAAIKILTSVQLIAALTELGFRNSLGVETDNMKGIIRLHILVSLMVLICLLTTSELTYFYLYCAIQTMMAAGGCYKIKQITELHFFGISFAVCICLIGILILVSNKFVILMAVIYFFLLLKLFAFAKGTDTIINFIMATNISKYATLSLPVAIVVPLDLYVSSTVINEFLIYHNTVRMLLVVSLPFIIYNYFNNIHIKNVTYYAFLGKNLSIYIGLFTISFALMFITERLGFIEIDTKLTLSYIALMMFGPIFQFIIRINKKLAFLYLFTFYLACFLPYYFSEILAAKFIFNLMYFCFVLFIAKIIVKYESQQS